MTRLNRRFTKTKDTGERILFQIPSYPAVSRMMKEFFTRPKSDFLKFLFKDCKGGFVDIRYIREGADRNTKRTFIPLKDLERAEIPTYDKYETIFGVCTRSNNKSGGKKDILEIPCLWADFDLPPSNFLPHLEKKVVPIPSAMVMTGRGTHIYWILDRPVGSDQIDRVEDLLKRLAYATNSDMSSTEAAHCLRVPGTRNFKRSSAVMLLPIKKRWVYSIDELDEKLPKIPEEKKKHLDTHITLLQGVLDGARHNSLASLVGTYLSKGLTDEVIWLIIKDVNEKNIPPLPDDELQYHFNYLTKKYRDEDASLLNSDSFSDTRMAERLKRIYGGDLYFCKERRVWFCWNDKYWEQDTKDCIITQSFVKEVSLYCSERIISLTGERNIDKDEKGSLSSTQKQLNPRTAGS